MNEEYCNGPLKQIGITDKGIPLWFCETCVKDVLGYNHEKGFEWGCQKDDSF
jgi:hypothetical protein